MNYKKIYDALISRAQNRNLEGYKEKHHIVPRCMNGNDEENNLIFLTPEEHFVAHELLVKIYPEEYRLIFALIIMNGKNPTTNKLFGWHKRKLSETQTKLKTGVKRGPQSEEHRKAIGDANRGENNGMFGKKASEETLAKLKGRVPWNKGKKGLQEAWNKGIITHRATAGCFKPGHIPWNKRRDDDDNQ